MFTRGYFQDQNVHVLGGIPAGKRGLLENPPFCSMIQCLKPSFIRNLQYVPLLSHDFHQIFQFKARKNWDLPALMTPERSICFQGPPEIGCRHIAGCHRCRAAEDQQADACRAGDEPKLDLYLIWNSVFLTFHSVGKNHPNWLSYVSEG